MRSYRTLRTAFGALRRNVMRAGLTTLGIVIGVAAVIAMMEIGNGSSIAIQSTISSMGANNLLIMPGTAASGGISFGAGSVLTMDLAVLNLARFAGWSLPQAIAAASRNPARVAQLTNKGSLAPGADADFVVLSPAGEVLRTFIAGRESSA